MHSTRHLTRNRHRNAIASMESGESAMGTVPGYYIVIAHTNDRHFIAPTFWETVSKLNTVCERYLTDEHFNYWIDRSIGLLIDGTPGWHNIDHVEDLLDADASLYC